MTVGRGTRTTHALILRLKAEDAPHPARFARHPARKRGRDKRPCGASASSLLFKFQTAKRNRPCSLRRRVRRIPFPTLVKYEGMARREGASGSSIAHPPFGKMRRPSARHRGVLSATGRASGNRMFRRPAISQLLAGGPSASERSPVTARGLGGAFIPLPQAPHPCSTIKTPLDGALVEQDAWNVRALESVGISYFRSRDALGALTEI